MAASSKAEAPVPLIDMEYERRRLELYLTKGMHCQIVGPPGIGKTALLSNVGRIATGLKGAFRVAYADLADPRCQTVPGLLERISAAWDISPPYTTMAQLGERVRDWRRRDIRPVLCLDHFEELLQRDREFTSDFFVDLRGVAQAGLMLLMASRKTLSELIPWYSRTSPFFNIFEILRLGPLPREAIKEMLESECSDVPPFTAQEKETLVRFANGYPGALREACAEVVQAKEQGESLEAALHRVEEDLRTRLPTWRPERP
jgi:hypothetical protein